MMKVYRFVNDNWSLVPLADSSEVQPGDIWVSNGIVWVAGENSEPFILSLMYVKKLKKREQIKISNLT